MKLICRVKIRLIPTSLIPTAGTLRKESDSQIYYCPSAGGLYFARYSRKILLWLEIPLLSQTIAELLPGITGNRNHRTGQFLSFMCAADV